MIGLVTHHVKAPARIRFLWETRTEPRRDVMVKSDAHPMGAPLLMISERQGRSG